MIGEMIGENDIEESDGDSRPLSRTRNEMIKRWEELQRGIKGDGTEDAKTMGQAVGRCKDL